MALNYVNTGTSANKGDGDSLRLAFWKINNNLSEVVELTKNFTFTNLVVHNTASIGQIVTGNIISTGTNIFEDIYVSGTVNVGALQGFDDINIIKDDADGLNFRLRNINDDTYTALRLLDNQSGGLVIRHQNSTSASPSYEQGNEYIFGDSPGNTLNLGRYADLNLWANRNLYFDPTIVDDPSIKITAIDGRVTISKDLQMRGHIIPLNDSTFDLGSEFLQWRSLYVSSSTIYIEGKALSIDDSNQITINGVPVVGAGGNGYTGSAGSTGAVGYTGSRGSVGYTGSAGSTGYTGSQGITGLQGPSGPQGNQGAQGNQGDPGPQGDPGTPGAMGYTGSVGQKGSTGDQGISVTLVGSTSTSAGLPLTGNPGDGWIVTDTGNLWFWSIAQSQWEDIGQIVGPQGDPGPIGPQGNAGYTGSEGQRGYVGSQGNPGLQGIQGDLGYTGSQGEAGQFGYTGSQGYVGSIGGIGYTGSAGATGDQGYTGSTGELGYTGSHGSAGYAGSAGYTGSHGDIGYTGSRGADGTSVTILGSYADLTALQTAHPTGSLGDAYILSGNGHLAVWNGSAWTDVGSIQGPIGYTGSRAQEDRLVNSGQELVLDADGKLTFPGGPTFGDNILTGSDSSDLALVTTSGATSNQWTFGADGWFSIPGPVTYPGAIGFDVGSDSLQIARAGGVSVSTQGGTWKFEADGSLTAPGHLLPDADLAYDLGSTTTQWRSIYVGTGTIYIGGVALGVNQDNYVTVDGNPVITVNTAGNITIQGDNILTPVYVSDVAPDASVTDGNLWYNSLDGRTYVSYSGQWVDTSPAVVPTPGTYLGEITVDGSTINMNGSTLAINTAGVLLVNGSEVTGSGYQLTSGTAVLSVAENGTVTFPNDLTVIDSFDYSNGMVDGAIILQKGQGVLQVISTGTGSSTVIGWGDNEAGAVELSTFRLDNAGAELMTGNSNIGTFSWYFGTDGSTTFPDDTILGTGLDPNVYIETLSTGTTNTWTFAASGIMTLPTGGDIVDSNGNSVLGSSTATVITLTESTQNFYLPNPDEVEVSVGTIYELSVVPLFGALDTQRDITIGFQNSVTYSPYFNGTLVLNKSDTGAQIQSVTPNTYFQWTMFTGTPNTDGVVSGQAKIVYCGTGTWSIPGNEITGHFYTVFANTDLYVVGG